jgi:hypothetical protein
MVTALQIPVADGGRYPLSATRIVRLGADIPLRKSRRHYIDVSIRIGKLEYLYSETPISLRGHSRFHAWKPEFPAWEREFRRREPLYHIYDCTVCNKRFIVLYSVADKRHLPPSATGICNAVTIYLLIDYSRFVAALQIPAHF